MMRIIITVVVLNGMLLTACHAGEAKDRVVKGLYFRFEGAEYESALVQCLSDDIWDVEGGKAFKELVSLYKSKSSDLSRYGEMFIEARGFFSPIDKTRFPNSHYVGVFRITALISHSTNKQKIDECRQHQQGTKKEKREKKGTVN